MKLAENKLKIDLKQNKKAELSPIQNETADGTNFILEPKEDKTKPMNNDTLKGLSAYNMSRPAKKIEYIQQVGSKGSAFPMVAPNLDSQGMAEAKEMQEFKNRAAGPQNRKMLENNPNIMQPYNKISASKFGQEKLMSSIASNPGMPNPQPNSSMGSGVGSGVGQATGSGVGQATGTTTPPTTYGDMVQDQSANQYDDLYAGAGSTPQTSTFGMYNGPSKALVGNQDKLPEHLKAKIEAAPGMYDGPADYSKNDAMVDQCMAPGMYGKNTKITKKNVNAAERDDAAHMSYLKRDVNYDAKHGGSKRQMLNDEKHISKLAGDLKYDHKKKRKYDNV